MVASALPVAALGGYASLLVLRVVLKAGLWLVQRRPDDSCGAPQPKDLAPLFAARFASHTRAG